VAGILLPEVVVAGPKPCFGTGLSINCVLSSTDYIPNIGFTAGYISPGAQAPRSQLNPFQANSKF